jgi:hypothetical protein
MKKKTQPLIVAKASVITLTLLGTQYSIGHVPFLDVENNLLSIPALKADVGGETLYAENHADR